MAHELTIRANGKAEHAYVGNVGWHGLGNELQAGATIEDWAIAAGMDWQILRSEVRYATALGQDSTAFSTMAEKHVLMRSDNFNALGIVSDSYKAVQPIEVLEFFRTLTESNGFTLDTAGTLFGGRRFWALAKINDGAYVKDKADRIKGYLLLVTSADGTLATEGRFVCERVVCNNTLKMAMGEDTGSRVKVTHRSTFNERDMQEKLGVVAESSFDATIRQLRELAHTRVSPVDILKDTVNLFNPGTYDADGKLTIDEKKLEKIERSAPVERVGRMALDGNGLIGADMEGMQGTAYGWLNSVTQYIDHEARTQKGDGEADRRMNNAFFGKGQDLKTKALQVAMQHADGSYSYVETEQAESVPDAVPDFTRLLGGNGAPPTGGAGGDDFAALLNRPRT